MINQLPKHFVDRLNKIYSPNELKIIYEGFNTLKRKVSFRVNTLLGTNKEIEKVLNDKEILYKKLPYLTHGYVLENGIERVLWDLDIYNDGKIYLQGITSQLVGEILKEDLMGKENIKILDLAASPGGKTSHMSSILSNQSKIIANDINAIRFDKLKYTINKQGCQNVDMIKSDARNLSKKFPGEYFDIIIADVPCSAEGRINLHKEKSFGFLNNTGNSKKYYHLQEDILKSTIPLLKKSGILLYSTCTLSPDENEGIVDFITSNYNNFSTIDMRKNFEGLEKYTKPGLTSFQNKTYNKQVSDSIRVLPSKETEGFFIAKFIKN